ncbi:MAG: hypothetical protein P1V51_24550 [Deltaproteobacteria bacterium]|nr:hypothetical protein [Deltaproteobacteria bacterium]
MTVWGHLRRALEAFLERHPFFRRLPALTPEQEVRLRALAEPEVQRHPAQVPDPMRTYEIPLGIRLAADLGWTVVPAVGWLAAMDGRLLQFPQRSPGVIC